jgi:DNA-binding protein HU-beta
VNKSQLVDHIAQQIEGGRSNATKAVDAVFDAIQDAVASGEKVTITGFGVFERAERAARTGRNPATGEPVQVAAALVPKFRPGSEFKARVSTNDES